MARTPQAKGWAVVTGASSGIGREFARTLAGRGYSLLIVARRRDRLEELARELASTGVAVESFTADLEGSEGPREVAERAAQLGNVSMLVNCAGFGNFGNFTDQPLDRILAAIRLNCTSLVELTQRLLPLMIRQPRANIVNIGSTLGLQPVPYFAVYAATKAFVISFSEALTEELSATGVRVTVVCPGPVKTEFANHSMSGAVTEQIPNLTPEHVVRTAMAACDRRKAFTVPGFVNSLLAFCPRIMPRSAMRGTMALMMKPVVVRPG